MIDKIRALAGLYLKCLWVKENLITINLTFNNINIVQNDTNDVNLKIELIEAYSLKNDITKSEKEIISEIFYFKLYNQKWYLTKSKLANN